MTAKTCAQCGCGHEDPSGSLPHADGNPYPQYTPEHRVWAIARKHGQASASWVTDGNTTKDRYRELLTGIREGDPAVLDSLPSPGLGEGYEARDLLAEAGWVPHDGTALRDELIEQYEAGVQEAFWHQVERDCIGQLKAEPEDLNEIMEFDHPVTVDADGIVTDAEDAYAPELIMPVDEDGQALLSADEHLKAQAGDAGWTLLTGWTGQYGYRGPVMHPSEFVGGRLAEHIIANPGTYVVTAVETDDGDEEPAGWAIAYRE